MGSAEQEGGAHQSSRVLRPPKEAETAVEEEVAKRVRYVRNPHRRTAPAPVRSPCVRLLAELPLLQCLLCALTSSARSSNASTPPKPRPPRARSSLRSRASSLAPVPPSKAPLTKSSTLFPSSKTPHAATAIPTSASKRRPFPQLSSRSKPRLPRARQRALKTRCPRLSASVLWSRSNTASFP